MKARTSSFALFPSVTFTALRTVLGHIAHSRCAANIYRMNECTFAHRKKHPREGSSACVTIVDPTLQFGYVPKSSILWQCSKYDQPRRYSNQYRGRHIGAEGPSLANCSGHSRESISGDYQHGPWEEADLNFNPSLFTAWPWMSHPAGYAAPPQGFCWRLLGRCSKEGDSAQAESPLTIHTLTQLTLSGLLL